MSEIVLMPNVVVYKNFFDSSLIFNKIKEIENTKYESSYISQWKDWYTFGKECELFDYNNVSEDSEYQKNIYDSLMEVIFSCLKKYIELHKDSEAFPDFIDDWNIDTIGNPSSIWKNVVTQILKYERNRDTDFAIEYHTDHGGDTVSAIRGDKSLISVLIYLNDDYSGGEISFLNEVDKSIITYKPNAGDVIVFPTDFWHASLPYRGTNKYFVRYFLTCYFPRSQEWLEGLEKFGEKWIEMETEKFAEENRQGIHFKKIVFDDGINPAKGLNFNYNNDDDKDIVFVNREIIIK